MMAIIMSYKLGVYTIRAFGKRFDFDDYSSAKRKFFEISGHTPVRQDAESHEFKCLIWR